MENTPKKIYVTRLVEFAAAHRLYRNDWSEEKNFEVFGACANPYGHGHNYCLEVTVQGDADPSTGMVIHFSRLKSILKEVVEIPMDHRNLNHDVVMMEGKLPTSENIVMAVWEKLSEAMAGEPFSLYKLSLNSTPRNRVDYFGPEGDSRAHG